MPLLSLTPTQRRLISTRRLTSLYKNDARAYNNLASMAMLNGDVDAKKEVCFSGYLSDPKQAEAYANRGLLSLVNGDISAAETDIAKASTLGDASYAQGVLNIAKGNYKNAESNFKGQNSNSAASCTDSQ